MWKMVNTVSLSAVYRNVLNSIFISANESVPKTTDEKMYIEACVETSFSGQIFNLGSCTI